MGNTPQTEIDLLIEILRKLDEICELLKATNQ